MKVNDSQKSDKTDDGISRETLNDWQRKDAAKKMGEAKHRDADPEDGGKSEHVHGARCAAANPTPTRPIPGRSTSLPRSPTRRSR